MDFLLYKIIPGTTQNIHIQHSTRLYFPFGILLDLFLHLFPNVNNLEHWHDSVVYFALF